MSADADRVDYLDHVRILVTDDNAAIHEDFRKILAADASAEADLRIPGKADS